MPRTPTLAPELGHLARLGAAVRLRQLEEEAAAIRKMFPGLRQSAPPAAEAPAAEPQPRRRRKRTVSAAAREAARERMKAYWARKKGLSPEGGEGGTETPEQTADAAQRAGKKRGAKKRGARKRGGKR